MDLIFPEVSLVSLIATLMFAAPNASADLVLTKDGRDSVVLTFLPDQTASIVDRETKTGLIRGRTAVDDEGNFTIFREEGEGCPDVRVKFKGESPQGEHLSADVTSVVTGSVAVPAECATADIDGRYRR